MCYIIDWQAIKQSHDWTFVSEVTMMGLDKDRMIPNHNNKQQKREQYSCLKASHL